MITRNVLKRFLLVVMLGLSLCHIGSAATMQETFSSARLDSAWTSPTSTRGSIEVKDGWMTFSTLPGEQAQNYIDQVTAMATGAAQLNYGPSHLSRLEIVVPSKTLMGLFDEATAPICQQTKVLLDCN